MSVILRLAPPLLENPSSNSIFLANSRRTKGLRVSLFGFLEDIDLVAGEPTTTKSWQLPRASFETLCRDWLHMDVLPASETTIAPDLYIATQTGAKKLEAMNATGIVMQPVLVICPSAAVAHGCTKSSRTVDKFGVFEYISQP
jgi:hypothetical protein